MNIIKLCLFVMVFALMGCQEAHKIPDPVENATYHEKLAKAERAQTDALHDSLVGHVQNFSRMQDELRTDVEKSNVRKKEFSPMVPTYDPLSAVQVTLDVDNGDVQHVLQALARQAGLNLLLHPNLASSKRKISLHFVNVPASIVFKEVLRITDLHGEVKGRLLVVNPYEEKILSVNFLETTQKGDFATGGDVLGSSQGSGGAGASGSSSLTGNFRISGSSASNSNPYDQLEAMLNRMVGSNLSDNTDGDIGSASSLREVGVKSSLQNAKRVETAKYVLNRKAGTLYIQAKPSVVKAVTEVIERYRKVLSRQVLLETQILEVRLNDGFQYGIDWANLRGKFATSYAGAQQVTPVTGTLPNNALGTTGITIPAGGLNTIGRALGLTYANGGLNITVGLLKGYGDVSVLSNPTIRAMNTQPSLISVGRTNSYIAKTSVTTATAINTAGTITSDVTVNSVFNGLILGVIPSISDEGEITLSIHPIQSEVDQNSIDTLIDVGGNSKITLPRVDIKEISTTIKLQDGDTVILGGLIDKNKSASNEGVPLLSDIPLLGYLFKSKRGTTAVREMVIVMRVHLL